jgi:hypothetical protein
MNDFQMSKENQRDNKLEIYPITLDFQININL